MSTPQLADFIKAYDVRGLYPEQLNETVSAALGAAFAQVVVLPEGAKSMVVGHDMRESSPLLSEAFAAGAADQGVDVTMIGLTSTDGLYFASGSMDLAGAMFTASHNPAAYNGIKLCRPEPDRCPSTLAWPKCATWPNGCLSVAQCTPANQRRQGDAPAYRRHGRLRCSPALACGPARRPTVACRRRRRQWHGRSHRAARAG
ncbi:hypothetical protein [Ornithinimicrobium sp. INDO-MA30-4]|uniref:hypothetical protein n=1 Tax=Ornithinimicrobium sp. INDO-MA30-4 TaxID=2908651 RepID=UPI0037C9086A